jgi:hypothetical protein
VYSATSRECGGLRVEKSAGKVAQHFPRGVRGWWVECGKKCVSPRAFREECVVGYGKKCVSARYFPRRVGTRAGRSARARGIFRGECAE